MYSSRDYKEPSHRTFESLPRTIKAVIACSSQNSLGDPSSPFSSLDKSSPKTISSTALIWFVYGAFVGDQPFVVEVDRAVTRNFSVLSRIKTRPFNYEKNKKEKKMLRTKLRC